MRNCLVAQSGGPTVAINASLAGVIDGVLRSDYFDNIYGSVNGIQGVLHENLIDLQRTFNKSDRSIERLKVSPSMYLGSCRYKLSSFESDSSEYEKIFSIFLKHEIKAFFYIGGNDSMDTVAKLSNYAKLKGYDISILGIPKTIDNDLCVTDHTPGYGSAAKYVATSLLEIAHDTYIYDTQSVTIVEIMGRDAGWLTAASALARNEYSHAPHLIYLPETQFDVNSFIKDVKIQLTKQQNVIIAVSEGIKTADGKYVSAQSAKTDIFGHAQLSGTGKYLEMLVNDQIGCKVRSIELNVLQRSAMHCASLTDLNESFALGVTAVQLAEQEVTNAMLVIKRVSDYPYQYKISCTDVSDVANDTKFIPTEWICPEGNDVSQDFITYAKPLICGEPMLEYKDGLPYYLPIRHLL